MPGGVRGGGGNPATYSIVVTLLWLFSRNEPTLPEIPLVRDFARESGDRAEELLTKSRAESFNLDQIKWVVGRSGELLLSDLFFEVENRYELEIIKADSQGSFEGSWIKGSVRSASIVNSEWDEAGNRKERLEPRFHHLDGQAFMESEAADLKEKLEDPDSGEPFQLWSYLDGYPVNQFFAVAEYDLPHGGSVIQTSFECFEMGTGFQSPSAHVSQRGNLLIGEADMFTWHPAAIRCSWDFSREGGILKMPMPSQPGKAITRGVYGFRHLTRAAGVFDHGSYQSDVSEAKRVYAKRETEAGELDTCFFASSIASRTFRGIEYSEDGENWTRAESTFEQGVGWYQIPSRVSDYECRILYYPFPVRVVADIPAVGGTPEYNSNVSTFNEVRFPLGNTDLQWNTPTFFLWHLLGSNWDIYPGEPNREAEEAIPADRNKLYTIDDLYRQLRENFADYEIVFHYDKMTFSARKPEGWWTKMKNEFQFLIIPE